MTITRRIAITLAVAAFLVSAAAALGALAIKSPAPEPAKAHQSKHVRSFRINGSVENLYPGVTTQLDLKLKNPHRSKIVVRKIKVAVGDASRDCPASNVTVPPFKGHVRVRHTKRMSLPVTMSAAAPSSCQNAIFSLTYRGRAVRQR